MARKNKTMSAPVEHSVNVNVKLEAKPETPFYYVNCMSVGHSAFDFTIGATRVPIPLSSEQTESAKRGEPIIIEPTLQLVLAPWVVKHLITALTDQLSKYEEQFGRITTQMPGKEEK